MRVREVLVVFTLLGSIGCFGLGDEGTPVGPTDPTRPTPGGAPLTFGGVVIDAATNGSIPDARVRIDLAQTHPCGRQGVGWSSWEPTFANGTFGPLEIPRPRSDDVAFFLHVTAPGYSENSTFIGSTQARAGTHNLTVRLHPDAQINGSAPPGTLLALEAPNFPRLALADANGNFVFPNARAADAHFVAGTEVPYRALVYPPAQLDVPRVEGRGWTLEGVVKSPTGAPMTADVVAWNGSALWSVARSGENGAFALPLAPEPVTLHIAARTSDTQYGGILVIEVKGPPALRETVLMRTLC